MNRWTVVWMAAVGLLGAMGTASAKTLPARVGAPAPDFSVTDEHGQTQSLAKQRGRYVVLEWFSPECPFVQKHYRSGNMQRLQHEAAGRGVVWWSVDSSAPGHPGHMSQDVARQFTAEHRASPTAVLLDEDGTVGQRYGAKTTPHLFIIDPKGILIYAGAIDDRPSVNPEDAAPAKNYVRQALDEAMAGKPVSTPVTRPYGCTVKY